MTPRPTTNRLVSATAVCGACSWRADTANALALAAQHYDRTRHPITTTVTNAISYGDQADADHARELAGQLSLNP